MRIRAALSLLAGASILVAGVSAQTPKQAKKTNKTSTPSGKPRSETLKICQGVPIPAGYVVVAFMTSPTCPHGLYILKKQDPYSESLAISKRGSTQPSGASESVTKRADASESPDKVVDKTAETSEPASQHLGPSAPLATSNGSLAPGVRPRRVGVTQPAQEISSIGDNDEAELPARPPRLIGATHGAPVSTTSNAVTEAAPEEVSEGDVVRIDTSFVAVPVSVLDRHGRFIPDLKREDFEVFENGVKQSIAHFEPAEKPFTVALLLDTSPSTKFHLWEIKEAAIAFARQLRPQDRVLVVSFNDQVLLLTEVTNDLNVINSVIVQNANMGTATRLYDALNLVITERLNKIKGRKAVVLFTDGVDTASYLATYQSTIREVEELDALIYPIKYDTTDYMRAMQGAGAVTVVTTSSNGPFPGTSTSHVTYGNPSNGGTPLPGTTRADYDRADQYLRELADKTAGRLHIANDTQQLSQAFSRIAEELRRQYSIGYYPQSSTVESGERRQIKVRVNRPNLAVRARESYMRSAPTTPAK